MTSSPLYGQGVPDPTFAARFACGPTNALSVLENELRVLESNAKLICLHLRFLVKAEGPYTTSRDRRRAINMADESLPVGKRI